MQVQLICEAPNKYVLRPLGVFGNICWLTVLGQEVNTRAAATEFLTKEEASTCAARNGWEIRVSR